MTDEEMAEARATTFADINYNEPDNYGTEKEIGYHAYYCGFLAGLKAGKVMAEADLATIAYMQGAEAKGKRIAELENENRRLRNEVQDLTAYCNQIGKIKTDVLKLFEHIVAK